MKIQEYIIYAICIINIALALLCTGAEVALHSALFKEVRAKACAEGGK